MANSIPEYARHTRFLAKAIPFDQFRSFCAKQLHTDVSALKSEIQKMKIELVKAEYEKRSLYEKMKQKQQRLESNYENMKMAMKSTRKRLEKLKVKTEMQIATSDILQFGKANKGGLLEKSVLCIAYFASGAIFLFIGQEALKQHDGTVVREAKMVPGIDKVKTEEANAGSQMEEEEKNSLGKEKMEGKKNKEGKDNDDGAVVLAFGMLTLFSSALIGFGYLLGQCHS